MSQSSITDISLSDEWSKWYVEHLEIMLTVNGIDSAERFITDSQGWPFSLVMGLQHKYKCIKSELLVYFINESPHCARPLGSCYLRI